MALADADADPLGPPAAYIASRDFRTVAELASLDADAAQDRIAAMQRARLAALRAAELAPKPKPRAARRNPASVETAP